MNNSRHNTATRNTAASEAMRNDAMRPFPFAVAWDSLTAQLQPREIRDGVEVAEPVEEPVKVAIVTVVNPRERPSTEVLVAEPPLPPANGRWEMVVPKMVRNEQGSFTRVDPEPRAAGDTLCLPPPPAALAPMFASYGREPMLSKAFSLLGRRKRGLLALPAPVPEETDARVADREAWLSRITKSLRSRPADKGEQR